ERDDRGAAWFEDDDAREQGAEAGFEEGAVGVGGGVVAERARSKCPPGNSAGGHGPEVGARGLGEGADPDPGGAGRGGRGPGALHAWMLRAPGGAAHLTAAGRAAVAGSAPRVRTRACWMRSSGIAPAARVMIAAVPASGRSKWFQSSTRKLARCWVRSAAPATAPRVTSAGMILPIMPMAPAAWTRTERSAWLSVIRLSPSQ